MNEQAVPKGQRGLIAALGCAFIGLLTLALVGGISLYRRFESADEEQIAATESVAVDVQAPEVEAPTEPEAPPMAPRYRPGPYVQVVGLLPSGLGALRRFASGNRSGHTLDNPWVVAGAELRPGAPPSGPSAGTPPRLGGADPLVVVPGAPATLPLQSGDTSQGLLLVFEGYEGYFYLPAVVQTELGTVRVAGDLASVQFGIDAPTLPGGGTPLAGIEMKARVRVALVDEDGNVSPWQTRDLRVPPVGTGDVEVALSMNAATDLDLYVVEPTGTVIYYGDSRAATGGHLDLDANAGCGSNMGVNTEHVYWPSGQAPAGTYQVRVAHFESCIGGAQVDYRLTVRNCGETAVFSGSFSGPGDGTNCTQIPGTNRNWCQQVVSFDVTPCAP